MQFINQSICILPQQTDRHGIMAQIELAGRVSHKSEDKITDDSAQQFVDMLMEKRHFAALEHGTVYLTVPASKEHLPEIEFLKVNPFTEWTGDESQCYITTNYRVIMENNLEGTMNEYLSDCTKHVKRVSIKIICSRGISHELVRHRRMSFMQESSRYVNYASNKQGGEVKFVIPSWMTDMNEGRTFSSEDITPKKVCDMLDEKKYSPSTILFISQYVAAEMTYMELVRSGMSAQNARDVLPNGMKTELVMTGTTTQWTAFLKLRSPMYGAKGMHPDMGVLADSICKELVAREIIKPL